MGTKGGIRSNNGSQIDWLSVRATCAAIGISTNAFYRWRQKYRDFPQPRADGLYGLEDFRSWLDAHPDIGEGAGNKVTGRREELMCDNLAKRNALLDRQIAEADRRLIDGRKVAEMLVRERTINQETFRKRLLSEIPAEAEGKRASAIAALLQDAYDEYLDDIERSIPRIVCHDEA
jgi:hypothetical protein